MIDRLQDTLDELMLAREENELLNILLDNAIESGKIKAQAIKR